MEHGLDTTYVLVSLHGKQFKAQFIIISSTNSHQTSLKSQLLLPKVRDYFIDIPGFNQQRFKSASNPSNYFRTSQDYCILVGD